MFDQMPSRVQQRLATALDNRRVQYAEYESPEDVPFYDKVRDPSGYALTGASNISWTSEGEGLDLILTFQCTIPWTVYRTLALTAAHDFSECSSELTQCGKYLLKLRVHVFGCKLELLAAEPISAPDSATMPLQALLALETHYLKNTGYLWRELFD